MDYNKQKEARDILLLLTEEEKNDVNCLIKMEAEYGDVINSIPEFFGARIAKSFYTLYNSSLKFKKEEVLEIMKNKEQ